MPSTISAALRQVKAASDAAGDAANETPAAQEDAPVEWVKLKLLKETEINGIKLSAESTVAVEQITAKKLIEDGMAEAVEEPAEETA